MSQMPEATSLESQAQPSGRPAARQSTKVDPLARRRLLLSGLGKGAAVVGVAVPLQTLASTMLVCNGSAGKNGLCTVSGFQSAMHSFGGPSGPTQIAARGRAQFVWAYPKPPASYPSPPVPPQPNVAWPASVPHTTLFKSVFGGSSTLTLFQVIQNGGTQASWITAYLNAAQYYPTSFPYPPVTTGGVTGVREWYSSAQSAQALSLFTQLETIYS
jgi:hypothetical protein